MCCCSPYYIHLDVIKKIDFVHEHFNHLDNAKQIFTPHYYTP